LRVIRAVEGRVLDGDEAEAEPARKGDLKPRPTLTKASSYSRPRIPREIALPHTQLDHNPGNNQGYIGKFTAHSLHIYSTLLQLFVSRST
jgi:hypothetical protein